MAEAAARALTDARHEARALSGFPGALPSTLAESYAVQEAAIGLWPDHIAGWKSGRVPDSLQASLGQDRISVPIGSRNIWPGGQGGAVEFPVIAGGFAAVETEFVVRVGVDADPDKTSYSLDEALALVGDVHIGVEIAGSPMAAINEIGPLAVVSDGDTYYPRLKLKDVKTVVEQHLAGGEVVEKLLYTDPATGERIACAHDIPFYKAQTRIALRDVGVIDPNLFDLLHRVRLELGVSQSFEVISAYRCPTTNESLRTTRSNIEALQK